MTSERSPGFDLCNLLTIDVTSELRKLAQAQLSGPWELPAELVRRAIRSGAQQIDVTLRRHRVRVAHDGLPVSELGLGAMAALLDPKVDAARKHEALLVLERSGDFALLAIVGLPPRRLTVQCEHAGIRLSLQLVRGRPVLQRAAGHGHDGTIFELEAPVLERTAILTHLQSSCRFAPVLLRINGRRLDVARARTLAVAPLRPPLAGELRLSCAGESAQAWLLEHGVVTTSMTVPNAPAFEAAIEVGHDGGENVHDHSPARVRTRFEPELGALREQAVELIAAAAAQAEAYPEELRARASRLVLAALRHNLHNERLMRVPIFRAVARGRRSCVDLQTLRRSTIDDGRLPMLLALYPHQRPERYALGQALVLIADETERSALADLLQIRFRPPDPHHDGSGTSAFGRRLRVGLRVGARHALMFVRHPRRHPPLSPAQLSTPEQRFLAEVRECMLGEHAWQSLRDVCLSEGAGPIRRSGTALVLPRNNKLVRACIIACNRDATWWLYPAVVALLDGRESPPEALRRRWLERVLR